MKRDFCLGVEKLDNKILLSSNPWYVDAIKAPFAWNSVNTSLSKPVVAIVDSGVDLNHPSLKSNLFHNLLDPIDGKDNDNNGYVDDYTGWDFVQNDNVPQDDFYHGTHVAGIVNAVANGNVDILPLKTHGSGGSAYFGSLVAAINYAVNLKKVEGVKIAAINCSWGGLNSIPWSLSNAIKNASDNGIVVVLAAGNGGVNLDSTPLYPGSLNYFNTITVGAINQDNSLAGYSNYGKNSVTVAAPGSNIYSTLPNGTYGNVSGTSMSTAVVSGSIGLLKRIGSYSANAIKNVISQGCDVIEAWADKIKCGLINLQKSSVLLKYQVNTVLTNSLSLAYKMDYVSNNTVSGWVKILKGASKPTVEIYVNKILVGKTYSNLYRDDTKLNNGFSYLVDKKYLSLSNNLIEVKLVDKLNNLNSIIYKVSLKI